MSFERESYWTSRGMRDSTRLHLQHYLFQRQFKFLLHPNVSVKKDNLKVADVGCANAAWLLELADELPSTSSLVGFDISPNHFPSPEWLPKNVSLHVQNILEPDIPEEFIGTFDVVNARALGTIIKNGECSTLLNAIQRLLKPGGYFQWVDMITADSLEVSAEPGKSKENCEKVCEVVSGWLKNLGPTWNAFEDWPEKYGMKILSRKTDEVPKPLWKAWNESSLTVITDGVILLPTKDELAKSGKSGMSREEYLEILPLAEKEMQNGAAVHLRELLCLCAVKL